MTSQSEERVYSTPSGISFGSASLSANLKISAARKTDLHTTATMVLQYLFVFAQVHDEFRIPELLSVAELFGIQITFPEAPEQLDVSRPFMVLGLKCDEEAKTLASRCILIKYVLCTLSIPL